MATFLKLASKHKRVAPFRIARPSYSTCIKSSSSIRRSLHPLSASLNTQCVRHLSGAQDLSSNNAASENHITTCTESTRPAALRGANRPDLHAKYTTVGQQVEGDFTVTKITPIASYDCTAYEFMHNGTGARYIHLDTADTNNAFAVALRTLPPDSSGVAHILEHTVLCGSRNYPVRDPFFHMLKRSLNTFMNAMTSADWTCYPFATQNEQDYHNLLSVYLDSVFFPNLNELDFMQEGHRFEFESVDKANLLYKGVVYNEMKGHMSDPNDIFAYNLQQNLFPDNLYRHNFGGNPPEIPKLSHQDLVHFHRKFYHPSNAVFYSYGDLGAQLQELDQLILSKFSRLDTADIDAAIQCKQPLFSEAKKFEAYTPEDALVADPHQQNKMCLSWICNDVSEFEDTFGLTVLSQLLLSGPNAPFYAALIKPNIGYGYAAATGYTMDAVQGSFSVGLTNIKEEDCERVENIILRTLKECVEKGFERERVEAVLHQFEIDQKQRSGTFGLNLLFRMISLITHRVYEEEERQTPIQALQIDALLQRIKEKVLGDGDAAPTEPEYFQNLIRKYLVENTHRISLVMKPDKNYMQKLEQEEKNKLLDIEAALSPESKQLIVEQSQKLAQYQAENNLNVEVLPTLKLSDIPRSSPDPTHVSSDIYEYSVYNELNDKRAQITSTFMSTPGITNGLSYYKLMYDVEPLFPASSTGRIEDNDFHMMLPLFCMVIGNMGAADMDYQQLSQRIELKTGGIGTDIHAMTPIDGSGSGNDNRYDRLKYLLEINSFCLNRNVEEMLNLMEDVLIHPNYDFYERLESLIRDKVQSDITQLIESGHSYAISHAASAFGRYLPATKINEKLEGISQILFAGQLSNSLQGQRYATLKELIAIFYDLSYQLFTQQGPMRTLFVSDLDANQVSADTLMSRFGPLDYFNHPSNYEPPSEMTNPSDYPKPVFARKYNVLQPLFNSANKFVDKKYKEQSERESKEKGYHQGISQLRNYFAVPTQVNYVAGVIPTVAYNHEDCATLRVIAKLLSLNYLHHEIREKSGAYGGGAAQNKNIFAMFSYRDPNSLKTVETFRNSMDWILKNENVSGNDIDQALLSLFSNLDAPKPPQQKGYQEVLQDIDEEIRQRHREQLLAVDKESIRRCVDQYLLRAFEENEVALSIVGRQDISENEKEKLQDEKFKYVTLG